MSDDANDSRQKIVTGAIAFGVVAGAALLLAAGFFLTAPGSPAPQKASAKAVPGVGESVAAGGAAVAGVTVFGITLTGGTLFGLACVGLAGVCLWVFPAILAAYRGHPDVWAITAVCLIFGLSGLGWAIALIWALTGPRETNVTINLPDSR